MLTFIKIYLTLTQKRFLHKTFRLESSSLARLKRYEGRLVKHHLRHKYKH